MRMASGRKGKEVPFQPSGEVSRIIPCRGGHAYLSDHLGRTHHLKYDSDDFAELCVQEDEFFSGKIVEELMGLGWTNVVDNMERVRIRQEN